MPMHIDAEKVEEARKRISDTAKGMLGGASSYIDGARKICNLLTPAGLDGFEKPFVVFVGIASETDEVPVGEVRDRWHPDAEIKLAPSWLEAERHAKCVGEAACRDAIEWLSANPVGCR